MRKIIASAIALTALALFASAPNAGASVQPTPVPETLQCSGNGASCNIGNDCCSKYCCSLNNHMKCVTQARSSNLSCTS